MLIYQSRVRITGATTNGQVFLVPAPTGRILRLDYITTSAVSSAAITSATLLFGSAADITGGTVGGRHPLRHTFSGPAAAAANVAISFSETWAPGQGPFLIRDVADPLVQVNWSAATADGNVCVGYHYE